MRRSGKRKRGGHNLTGIRRIAVSIVLVVSVLAVGLAIGAWLVSTKPLPARRAVVSRPPLVEVLPLAAQDVQQVFVGYGSARADRQATLAAEVAGEIVEIAQGVNDGSPVEQGQPLIRIDDREYLQQLARAQGGLAELDAQLAQLEVEKENLQRLVAIAQLEVEVNSDERTRLSGLFEKGEASKTEYNFARRTYDRSRRDLEGLNNQLALIDPRRTFLQASRAARAADTELARLYVERCRIAAPFSGQISELMVEIGDRVMPGSRLAGITCLEKIEVPVELPISVRPLVVTGAPCTLEVESNPSLRWAGAVSRLAPVADERSRTFAAYVEVDNRQQETPLIPGFFLTARVHGPLLRKVLAIPRGAIDNGRVFTANNNQAHGRRVRVDTVIGETAVVTGELAEGDRLILTNLDVLFDGAPIRLQEVPTAGSTPAALLERGIAAGRETPP